MTVQSKKATDPLYERSDVNTDIDAAEGKTQPRSNKAQITRTREALQALRRATKAFLCWVPGHADIIPNEIADRLAKRGASKITSFAPLTVIPNPTRSLLHRTRALNTVPTSTNTELELADNMQAASNILWTPEIETMGKENGQNHTHNLRKRKSRSSSLSAGTFMGTAINFESCKPRTKRRKANSSHAQGRAPIIQQLKPRAPLQVGRSVPLEHEPRSRRKRKRKVPPDIAEE